MAVKGRFDDDVEAQRARLLREYNVLLQTRRLWEPQWQEIANFLLPRKNDIILRKSPGSRREEKLFDSTAIFASELLAASLHGTLTSSYNRWFGLLLDDLELQDDAATRDWLAACAEDIRLTFNRSNHAQEAHEGYIDIVGLGTFVLLMEDRKDEGKAGEFRFTSVHLQHCAIGEDGMGRVNRVYRSFPLTRAAILERWPNADYTDSDLTNPDANQLQEFEVIHAVIPSKFNKNASLTKPGWLSVYFLAEHKVRLSVDSFTDFPYLVPRWTKTTGETWGRGRGHTALPDIKSLNKIVELFLRSLGKQIDPPLTQVGGDVVGQVKLSRGGLTTIRRDGAIKLLYEGWPTMQPVDLTIQRLTESIKKMFYADQLQMPTDNPQMTATESNIRYELMQRILGPTLGRLESEYLGPMLSRAFAIRRKAGKLPDPPPQVTKQAMLAVAYEGPLARAQRAGDVAAVQQLLTIFEPLLQAQIPILDNIDFDGLAGDTAAKLGIPARVIKDQKVVDEERQQKAPAQQEQQDKENQINAVKAAGGVAGAGTAPQPGSPMDKMMGGGAQNGPQKAPGK